MTQRNIELLIGRLITDERFRAEFARQPAATLGQLCERGLDLSPVEIAALTDTDLSVWERAASAIDARLRKLDLSAAPSALPGRMGRV